MNGQAPRDPRSHPLAPLIERALGDLVALARTVVQPLKRAIDANPELPLNLALGWDALERLKATRLALARITT